MERTLDSDHLADNIEQFVVGLELLARAVLGAPSEDDDRACLVERLIATQARITERTDHHPSLAASRLQTQLGLSPTELQVVWMLAAISIDRDVRALVSRVTKEAAPSTDGIRTVVYGNQSQLAFEELGPYSMLPRLDIIERCDGGQEPHESHYAWALSRRVLSFLYGGVSVDRTLRDLSGALPVRCTDELSVANDACVAAARAMSAGRAIVVASGMPGLGRRTLLAAAANEAGIEVLEIDARKLSKDAATFSRQLRAIARECKLLARVPLIANLDALVADKEGDKENRIEAVGAELVSLVDGLVLVTCGVQRPAIRWDRPVIVIELGQPTSAQRATLWRAALGQGTDEDAQLLADQYPLAPALIHHAAEAAKARAGGKALQPDDIFGGIRAVLDDRLGQFAKRVTVTQTWDDLVLPRDQRDSIDELMARIRERRRVYEEWGFAAKVGKGLGVSALFSGPPGTGKTMVAALIARDLGLELYQVDLAKLVSKWIGETEKNLAALFDAAEAGHAILLFDEADALFGKRTEVKSSNDRYANLETNYLLQRLESFTGICLLTSNHESSIDVAFQRRLSLHLRFDVPDVDERAQLWQAMLPAAAPTAPGFDFGSLAQRYAMSGGYIRNAALRAAFLAANDDAPIAGTHLERAARLEYEAMGKLAF